MQLKVSHWSQDFKGWIRTIGPCELYLKIGLIGDFYFNTERKQEECTYLGTVLS